MQRTRKGFYQLISNRLWFLCVNCKWLRESASVLHYTYIVCLVGLCLTYLNVKLHVHCLSCWIVSDIPQDVTCWFVSEKSVNFFLK